MKTHFAYGTSIPETPFAYETLIPKFSKIIKNNFGIAKNVGCRKKNIGVQKEISHFLRSNQFLGT